MSDQPQVPVGEVILYQTEDGRTRVECRFQDETIWLSQALISELFDVDVRTVNEHLHNIFVEGELSAEATIRKFRIVRHADAKKRAEEEYEEFAARRRILLEAEGEQAQLQALESAAAALPAPPPPSPPPPTNPKKRKKSP